MSGRLAGLARLQAALARLTDHDPSGFVPFRVAGLVVGRLRPAFAARLRDLPDLFAAEPGGGVGLRLSGAADATEILAEAVQRLAAAGAGPTPKGEAYPILTAWGAEPLGALDRAWVQRFGLRAFGLHVNGTVAGEEGAGGRGPQMWIGRRAPDRQVEPDRWDHLVAGGQPAGLTLAENLIKEAEEEAGLPAELASRARPVGCLRYACSTPDGVRRDTLFLYDLELPRSFEPRNQDGEVAHFELWTLERLFDELSHPERWKFNVLPVVLDWLIRRGQLDPDREPGFCDLATNLRGPAA